MRVCGRQGGSRNDTRVTYPPPNRYTWVRFNPRSTQLRETIHSKRVRLNAKAKCAARDVPFNKLGYSFFALADFHARCVGAPGCPISTSPTL